MIRHRIPKNWHRFFREPPATLYYFDLTETEITHMKTVRPGQPTKVRLWWKPWKTYWCIEFPKGFDLNYVMAYADPGFIRENGERFTEEKTIELFLDFLSGVVNNPTPWYAPAGFQRGLGFQELNEQ